MRDAILKAADHIESHPETFHFMATDIPHACDSPGCALGWVGFFAGIDANRVGQVADAMSINTCDFYDQMDKYAGREWIDRPELCAVALRGYANEFHPVAIS